MSPGEKRCFDALFNGLPYASGDAGLRVVIRLMLANPLTQPDAWLIAADGLDEIAAFNHERAHRGAADYSVLANRLRDLAAVLAGTLTPTEA